MINFVIKMSSIKFPSAKIDHPSAKNRMLERFFLISFKELGTPIIGFILGDIRGKEERVLTNVSNTENGNGESIRVVC